MEFKTVKAKDWLAQARHSEEAVRAAVARLNAEALARGDRVEHVMHDCVVITSKIKNSI